MASNGPTVIPAPARPSVKCFVVGCSRSGTTLLSVLLDRHSLLAMTPETAFYKEIAPQMIAPTRAPLAEILARWRRLPELGLSVETVLSDYDEQCGPGALLDIILRHHARLRGKPFCGEKTPVHWRHLPSLLEDFPSAGILCIVRDGRDAALSLNAMPWWRFDLRAAAAVWLEAAKVARGYLEACPTRFMVLRYEDLVACPERTLMAAMNFIGLTFEQQQLDSSGLSGVVLPRSMQWKGRALAPIDQSRVGHWKTSATAEEATYLNDALGPELASFGYA